MAILLLQGTTKETSSYAVPLPFISYVWKRNLHSSSKTRVAATSTLSLKANLLHTWAAFENELSASSSSHLSKTITGVLLYFAAEIPSLTASEKSLHSFVRKRKAKQKNHEIEICQEIGKSNAFVGKMFFTEFRNRSMSYKESQQQIHVSDHTQTILGEKRKGSSKALMRRTNRIQGASFCRKRNVS